MSAARHIGVAALAISLVGVGVAMWWTSDTVPSGEPVDVDVASVSLVGPSYVRIRGVAHYGSLVRLQALGGLVHEPTDWYVFGLFAEGDLTGRHIRVLVRTMRPPERTVSFEYLTVEGMVVPPDPRKVPPRVHDALARGGEWWLADDVVVVDPVRIHSEDGVWEGP